jgi:hypothetical protein
MGRRLPQGAAPFQFSARRADIDLRESGPNGAQYGSAIARPGAQARGRVAPSRARAAGLTCPNIGKLDQYTNSGWRICENKFPFPVQVFAYLPETQKLQLLVTCVTFT